MGKVIKGNFGGGQEKIGENNSADNADNKPADVVEIKPGIQGSEPFLPDTEEVEKWLHKKREFAKEAINSVAEEFPAPEIAGREIKKIELSAYFSSYAPEDISKIRFRRTYQDNKFVFDQIASNGEMGNLYNFLEGSSVTNWVDNPVYYLALLDTLDENSKNRKE